MQSDYTIGGMNLAQTRMFEHVCFIGADGEQLAVADIINSYHAANPRRTRKAAELDWSAFKRYALANPNEFNGPRARLVQIRFGIYQLVNGDMTGYDG